jgi:hydrogenase nickel incorporation protein HypA/HybF
MHELSIASALIEQVCDEAASHQMKKVETVEIHAGFLRQVILEVMQEAFREVTAGTIAEGATLIIKGIPAKAKCRLCEKIFEPKFDCFLCPLCGKADVEILEGNEILLMSINGA